MRRNQKNHIGRPCRSVFDFLSRFGRDFLHKCHIMKIMAGNSDKRPSGDRREGVQGGVPRFHGLSPWSSRFPIWRQRGFFFAGGGDEVWVPGRGKGKCLFLKGVSFKGFSFHFHGKSLFRLCKRLISTAEVYFYSGGIFLRWRHISTAEAYFYRGGVFLRWRHISTAEAHLYGGSVFLRRRHISPAEVYLYEESVFLRKRSI